MNKKNNSPCPKCQGINTYKAGKNASGNQMIYCRDCDKQITTKKPHLSTISCLVCGQLGIKHRKPCLCSNCYQRKHYNRQLIENAFNFDYPENFDIET